jgi:hypothetical protein
VSDLVFFLLNVFRFTKRFHDPSDSQSLCDMTRHDMTHSEPSEQYNVGMAVLLLATLKREIDGRFLWSSLLQNIEHFL